MYSCINQQRKGKDLAVCFNLVLFVLAVCFNLILFACVGKECVGANFVRCPPSP